MTVHDHCEPLAGVRVLVADDDRRLLAVYRRMVAQLGGDCELATDGAQAVEACRDRRFELVIMDLDMPVMDGVTAIEQISSRKPSPTIIAVTALADRQTRARSVEAGASTCLSKPLAPEQVKAAVSEHLHGGSATGPPASPSQADRQTNFDPARIDATMELMGGDAAALETINGLMHALRQDAPDSIRACRATMNEVDGQHLLARHAHTLASRSAALGLTEARELAAALEREGRSGTLDELRTEELLQGFEQALRRGLSAADIYIQREYA